MGIFIVLFVMKYGQIIPLFAYQDNLAGHVQCEIDQEQYRLKGYELFCSEVSGGI